MNNTTTINTFNSDDSNITTQQTFVLMKTSSRRLDEDEYILINHTSSENVYKMFSIRLGQDQYIRLVHTSLRSLAITSLRHLQDVFKTSSRRLANTS